jgi:hypothetical protein
MLASGRADKAVQMLKGLTAAFPQLDEIRYVLACVQRECGDIASANKGLQAVANRKANANALRQKLNRRSQRFNPM